MRNDKDWKAAAVKIAWEALKDASGSKEEMASLARTALQPLIQQFEHAGKIEEAVNGVHVDGADYDELRDARESVREALEALPKNSTRALINAARDQALLPVTACVTERIAAQEAQRRHEEAKRQRELVLLSISRRLPHGISDEDEKAALSELTEALDDLPPDASESDMGKARDEIVREYEEAYREKARRAEKKTVQARAKANLVQYGLSQIRPYAERLLHQFDYVAGESVWDIDRRVRSEVQKTLQEELNGTETEQEVARIVREIMREVEGCN